MAYGSVNVPGAMPHKQDALTGLPGQVLRFDGMGLPYAAAGWSNRNIIHNWYLRRPVNQRGRTEYTGSGSYCIDRYVIRNGNVIVQLTDDGLVISRSDTTFGGISQQIENGPELLAGKTVTLSALIDELSCGSVEIFLGNSTGPHLAGDTYGTVRTQTAGLITTTITLPDELPHDYLSAFFWIDSAANGGTVGSVKPAAIKLELGDHQTLARQNEDGEWELIDPPPNKTLELAMCQRYQFVLSKRASVYEHILSGVFGDYGKKIMVSLYLPQPLRAKPTVSFSDDLEMLIFTANGYPSWSNSYAPAVPSSVMVYYSNETTPKLTVAFEFGDHIFDGDVSHSPVAILITNGQIIFDAN